MKHLNEKVERIDLAGAQAVLARLPACPACGGQLGKHCARYDDGKRSAVWFAGWLHSWRCLQCGKATGEFRLQTWESMIDLQEESDYYMVSEQAIWERDDADARYFL